MPRRCGGAKQPSPTKGDVWSPLPQAPPRRPREAPAWAQSTQQKKSAKKPAVPRQRRKPPTTPKDGDETYGEHARRRGLPDIELIEGVERDVDAILPADDGDLVVVVDLLALLLALFDPQLDRAALQAFCRFTRRWESESQ